MMSSVSAKYLLDHFHPHLQSPRLMKTFEVEMSQVFTLPVAYFCSYNWLPFMYIHIHITEYIYVLHVIWCHTYVCVWDIIFVYLLLSLQTGYRKCSHHCPHAMNMIYSWWSMNNIIQSACHATISCTFVLEVLLQGICFMSSLLSKNGCRPFWNWFGKLHPHMYVLVACVISKVHIAQSDHQKVWYSGNSLYSRHHSDPVGCPVYTVEPLHSEHHWDPVGCPV